MEARSQILIAATEALAQSRPSQINSRMYEELALQHLPYVSASHRMQIARLLCPLPDAPSSVVQALGADQDQAICSFMAQKIAQSNEAADTDKAPQDNLEAFLSHAPLSSYHDLADELPEAITTFTPVPMLPKSHCETLTQRGLKNGHASLIGDLARICGLTPAQVHRCCTHSAPDGFIVLLTALGFDTPYIDRLLVRLWGTLIDADAMRDLQKCAAGICRKTAGKLIASWKPVAAPPRYKSIYQEPEAAVRACQSKSKLSIQQIPKRPDRIRSL